MTEQEYRETIKRLEEINENLFLMVLEQSKYIREMENMQKVRRIEKA